VQMFLMSSQEGCFASHGFIFLFFRNKSDSQCLNLCYGHFTFVGYILKKMKIVSGVTACLTEAARDPLHISTYLRICPLFLELEDCMN